MPTNKPRFSVTFEDETLERVEQFRKKYHYGSRGRAIIALVEAGLSEYFSDANRDKYEQLERIRTDPRARALFEACVGMSNRDISQMEAFARFLRSEKDD